MARQLNTVLVVSTNYADPKHRPAFDARLTATAEALLKNGVTEASVIFVGDRLQHRDKPIDLVKPAEQLSIPTLPPGNAIQALLESWEGSGPDLVVVLANLAHTEQFPLDRVTRRVTRSAFLFVTDGDPAGFKAADILFGVSRQTAHLRVVMPGQSLDGIAAELDHLFMFMPLR